MLSELLSQVQPVVARQFPQDSRKPVALFFSISDGANRAHVDQASGTGFLAAWKNGAGICQREATRQKLTVKWLRVDTVTSIEKISCQRLQDILAGTKRNYFRMGISLDANLKHSFLAPELEANAMLYPGADNEVAALNEKNFSAYAREKYGAACALDFQPDTPIWLFTHQGVFASDDQTVKSLPAAEQPPYFIPGPTSTKSVWQASDSLSSGRRQIPTLTADQVYSLIQTSSVFLAKQVKKDGQFIYGHFPCFGRQIATYNALRHASSVYSMLEAWELTRDESLMAAIKRALDYLVNILIRRYPQPDGTTLAFNIDINGEIKLGANAVSLLALVKYDELTGDTRYRKLMEHLALGIAHMQNADSGKFLHVLTSEDLSIKNEFRIVYYDGEAAFGLMRLYGLTRDERWLSIVERAFDYFIEAEHWRHHDHWLSYCANELTLYKPEEKYFRFGVQNIAGYLDFILERETTYPTLLELSMAFAAMLDRINTQHAEMRQVLVGLDIEKFYRALQHRAHYLLNGFFWPEFAMYFAKPGSIVGSFFIRHHSFRVRIDDVEHYLSGYVAYWKMLFATTSVHHERSDKVTLTRTKERVLFLHGNLRDVGNGIEVAGIRRARLFHEHLGITPSFLISNYNPNLRHFEAYAKEDGRLPATVSIFSVYEWLAEMALAKKIRSLSSLGSQITTGWQLRRVGCAPVHKHIYKVDDLTCCEEFFGSGGEIWLRKYFSTRSGEAALTSIEMCDASGEVMHFATEGLWLAYMVFSNLDPGVRWHFVIDKNKYYSQLSKSPLSSSFPHTKTAVIHSTHLLLNGHVKSSYSHLFKDENTADRLVVMTQEQRQDLLAMGVPANRVLTIPHAYSALENLDRGVKIGPARTAIYLARYAPEKQHYLLFKAFTKVVEQIPDAKLHTYGTGVLASELRDWVTQAGLSNNIKVHGHTKDLVGAYRQADVGVLTSKGEGFSLFALECLAHQLPLISFSVKYGPRDLLEGQDAGILITPHDTEELANTLIHLFQRPEKIAALRLGAARSVKRFNEAAIAKLWKQWWQDVRTLGTRRTELSAAQGALSSPMSLESRPAAVGSRSYLDDCFFDSQNRSVELIGSPNKIDEHNGTTDNTRLIFENIFQKNGWGNKQSLSGPGSTLQHTEFIIKSLPEILKRLGVKKFLDCPCGDFNWMKHVDFNGIEYIGGDIVGDLIKLNNASYANAGRSFLRVDIIKDDLPEADCIFVRDCLVHLPFTDILKFIKNLKKTKIPWLITTTFPGREANSDIQAGRWRPLNLEVLPFNFPMPSCYIFEHCSESGGKYRDKSLGVWDVSKL